jgi:zinc D-Ala-D-Ala carboxypeptidase
MYNHVKIAKNFYLYEFESPDTHEVKVHDQLLQKLQKLRDRIEKPLKVTSGYRTTKYHIEIYKALYPDEWEKKIPKNSFHLLGMAVDISTVGLDDELIKLYAEEIKFNGIIRYIERKIIHLDVRNSIYHKI